MVCFCILFNDGVILVLIFDYVFFDVVVFFIFVVEYLYMQKVNIVEIKYFVIIYVDMLYFKCKNFLNYVEK